MEVTASDTRELALALHELSWHLARFGPAQVGLDPLPSSELAVLRTVFDQPGRGVSEVAAATAMQPSNASTAVRALVGRGLLEKRPDPHDGRMAQLYPTARALTHRSAIDAALSAAVCAGLAGLSAEHVAALLAAVPAIRQLTAAVTAPAR